MLALNQTNLAGLYLNLFFVIQHALVRHFSCSPNFVDANFERARDAIDRAESYRSCLVFEYLILRFNHMSKICSDE